MSGYASELCEAEVTLQICALVNGIREMHRSASSSKSREALAAYLLSLIREIVPADKGGLLLGDQVPRDSLQRHLLSRLLMERGAIHESSIDGSMIAVPLLVRREMAGMIHLENGTGSPSFSDTHLQALTALAQIAAVALENAFDVEWREGEGGKLTEPLEWNDEMAGMSGKLADLRAKIGRLAPTSTTVLILGESGTGKELVARSLHRRSTRSSGPFIAINCAALTESLLESELFGHEKGAFTGAVSQKPGRLEMAEGGTVFLDEIGEMPLSLQAKLLRVLQNREFERVGGVRTLRLDIRLLAATNRDLEDSVRRGLFREDLFYRLNVVTLRTPPLRERPEDILPLAQHFGIRFSASHGRPITGISPTARSALRSYEWPGNVRELENAIEHAVVLGTGEAIRAEDLPVTITDRWREVVELDGSMLNRSVNAAKRSAVKRAFELTNSDHGEAAKLLGVHPNYLYRLLHNLELAPLVKVMSNE